MIKLVTYSCVVSWIVLLGILSERISLIPVVIIAACVVSWVALLLSALLRCPVCGRWHTGNCHED